jgi:hypothetical protein
MKKWFIPALLAALLLCACSKTVNNWVYIYTEVTDFEELQDSVAGAAMGKLLDEAAYKAAGASPYAFIYNRTSTFENVEKAADTFYDQVKDTVTAQYSLTLQKVLSTSAMKLADQTKEPIRKYSFNRE